MLLSAFILSVPSPIINTGLPLHQMFEAAFQRHRGWLKIGTRSGAGGRPKWAGKEAKNHWSKHDESEY